MDLFQPAYSLAAVIAALVAGLVIGRITAAASDPRRAEQRKQEQRAAALSAREHVSRLAPEVRAAVDRLLAEDRKIEAIRDIRYATGLGLKEAKDMADLIERESRTPGGARAP